MHLRWNEKSIRNEDRGTMIIYLFGAICIFWPLHLWEKAENPDYGNAQVALLFIFALLWPLIILGGILGEYKVRRALRRMKAKRY